MSIGKIDNSLPENKNPQGEFDEKETGLIRTSKKGRVDILLGAKGIAITPHLGPEKL